MKKQMEITSAEELSEILKSERKLYLGTEKIRFDHIFRRQMKYEIYRFIELLRSYEYFCYKRENAPNVIISKYWVWKVKFCDRKKNRQGMKLGLEITPNMMDQGVRICHPNVILNGFVGTGCVFHGNNVIGNKRTGAHDEVPTLGKNVDVGVGAIIIGDVKIADDCVIGAGAVVTKSFLTPGTVIAGVPAREISPKRD